MRRLQETEPRDCCTTCLEGVLRTGTKKASVLATRTRTRPKKRRILLLLEEEEDDDDKWLYALPVSVCVVVRG